RRVLSWADAGNGVVQAALFTASFSMGLGYHHALPFIGFGFGLFGRYLARMRAWVAFYLGDGLFANACAMAFDAALGVSIVPATSLTLGAGKIIWGSVSHTLSRGALRLFFDKRFSTGHEGRQAFGVLT